MYKTETENVVIRKSRFGKGIFAKKPIRQGTVLLQITGMKEISFKETLELKEKECYCLQVDIDKYIIPASPFYFSNHSCEPNCAINHALQFFALNNIKEGDELLWDYSTSIWERHWTMKCNCGSAECRHIIADFDFLPKYLIQKYLALNIVLPFIIELYKTKYKLAI